MFASQNLRRRPGVRVTGPLVLTNVLLDVIRDGWDSGNPLSCGHEALFQLARHWALWQSARIGTFPLNYRDPSGPVSRGFAEETGEDQLYWDLDEQIRTYLIQRGATITEEGNDNWTWEGGEGDLGVTIQDMLAHAVAVLDRLENLAVSLGHSL